MSMMSSEIWNAMPTARPYRRSAAISLRRAPENIPPYRAQVSISAAVFSSSTAQVVADRVVLRAGPDGLPGLPGDQLGERLGDDPHRVRPETGDQPGGVGEQEVAGQDRDRVVPAGVGGLGAPRRRSASSITSSWYSVARWISSTTADATITSSASGSARHRPPPG